MAAPWATAASAAATLADSRSPTARPVTAPSVDLRDQPSNNGDPSASSSPLAAQQFEVVGDALAEADARIEDDAPWVDPGSGERGQSRAQEIRDLDHDIVVLGALLHRQRRAAHVHQADAAGGMRRDHVQGTRRLQGGNVVDDVGASASTAAMTSGLLGVDRDRAAQFNGPRPAPAGPARVLPRPSTGSDPGRVDSPPMSSRSAPSASSRTQCATAAAVVACRPPSAKESGSR